MVASFEEDIADQVRVYDARFAKESASLSVISDSQTRAFGKTDGTGVEAVNDVMPTEAQALRDCLRPFAAEVAESRVPTLTLLDFGCGDGRYLEEFLRISQELCPLRVLASEISPGALRTLRLRARQLGCEDMDKEEPAGLWQTSALRWERLEVILLLADGTCEVDEVEERLRQALKGEMAHVVVCGWGTLSCMPPRDGKSRQEAFLASFRRLGRALLNVVSNRNGNHIVPQQRFAAMRQALQDPALPEKARGWLERRVRMAVLPDSYYYPVGSGREKEWLFYSGISEERERSRLLEAGWRDVEIRICNVINFFTILTQPRGARLNGAVIALLEKKKLWEAQLLLSRAVAKVRRRPLSELRRSAIFDEKGVRDQVARYFISVSRA